MSLDLLVIPDEIASGIYEIRSLFDYIKTIHRDFTYDVVIDRDITKEILNSAKCILFFRSRSVLDYGLAQLCKRLNKTVYLFIDDDFLGLRDDYGVNGAGIWKGRKNALRKMLPLMNAIISPNDLLNEKYADLGGITRKVRIDTSVDSDSLIRNGKVDKGRIVLYINDGTIDMFNKYLRPGLKKLGEIRPNVFQIDLLSLKPNCDNIEGVTVNFVPHMTYPQFREYMNGTPFFLGLAPLDNEGFNQYKYFNKYIEYTRAGIVGIYSDCPLYRQVIQNGVNGLLVENTADAWVDAILYCYDYPDERRKYLENAQTIISDQFNKDSICKRLITGLPEMFGSNNCKMAVETDIFLLKVLHYWSRLRERCFLLNRYLKTGGIKVVIAALQHRRERNKEKVL